MTRNDSTQGLRALFSYQISSKCNFVGKSGFARAAHTLRLCTVSSREELGKAGKLSKNRRFFDKSREALIGGSAV